MCCGTSPPIRLRTFGLLSMSSIGLVPYQSSGTKGFQNGATGPALVELQTGPTDRCIITLLSFFICNSSVGAAAFGIGFGRSASPGVFLVSQPLRSSNVENGASTDNLPGITVGWSWQTEPTQPTNFLRRATANDALGNSGFIEFRFPSGLRVAPSGSVAVWFMAGSSINPVNLLVTEIRFELDT